VTTRLSSAPLRVAIIGTGGCALTHHMEMGALEKEGRCQVVATCDPFVNPAELPAGVTPGIPFYSDYREMLDDLAGDLDCVTVPTPIPLHAEMHQKAVECGVPCYLEKPPTLDPDVLQDMLEVEEKADSATFVGFGFIHEAERRAVKERLLQGEFGALRRVTFLGLCPRNDQYYRRTYWAGRLLNRDGTLLLDSPFGNGLSHFVHAALFWSGDEGLWHWGTPKKVRAELFRAHQIEGADTFFVECLTGGGIPVRIVTSHACHPGMPRVEQVVCERATIEISHSENHVRVLWQNGTTESIERPVRFPYRENFRWYFDYLTGKNDRPLTRLEDSLPLVHLHAMAYASSGEIHPVPESSLERISWKRSPCPAIRNLESMAERFLAGGQMPSGQGMNIPHPGIWVEADAMASVPELLRAGIRNPADGALACPV